MPGTRHIVDTPCRAWFALIFATNGMLGRLRGFRHLAKVIEDVKFNDGIDLIEDGRAAA